MSNNPLLAGLSLKVSPLGEYDRLITLLSDSEGITRLAVPGARKPRSHLAAAVPLTLLEVQITGRKGLKRIQQLKVVKSFNTLGKTLETLSAGQAIAELSLLLVAEKDPLPGFLNNVLVHLQRLEALNSKPNISPTIALACAVQACIHLLRIGGYGLPLQQCARSHAALIPPIGEWHWRCSLLAQEGFVIGSFDHANVQLNPSELALLQRLCQNSLPFRKDGELLGPTDVWLKLLKIIEDWINTHLPSNVQSLSILREAIITSELA